MRVRRLDRRERLDLAKAALLILAILTASLVISLHADPESIHGPERPETSLGEAPADGRRPPAHRRR